jgi:hypothetical protein
MEFIGKTKNETARNKITIRKNPDSVLLRKDFLLFAQQIARFLAKQGFLIWARENAKDFLKCHGAYSNKKNRNQIIFLEDLI